MDWYYEFGGREVGPVSDHEMERLVARGTVNNRTLVWCQGMSDWQPYGQVKEGGAQPTPSQAGAVEATPAVAAEATPAPESFSNYQTCCECGRSFPEEEMMKHRGMYVCAACKPVFVQRLREGARLPTEMVYAGFWIRFAAKIIDGLILWAVNMVIALVFGAMMAILGAAGQDAMGPMFAIMGIQWIVQMGIQIAYATWFGGRFSATPGKMAVGIKIVTPDGEEIDYRLAFLRCLAEFLSGLTLTIGYIIAAFDDEKRTLHDRIVGTRVIQK